MNLTSKTSRRTALALLTGALTVPMITGCQSQPSARPNGPAGAAGGDAAGSFPVTIKHALGSTTIERAPRRVVTVGYTDHESFLALGVKPVGVRPWFGEKIDHTWPWVRKAWGGTVPTYVGEELALEKIAELRPDLIVGLYAEITQEEYAKLSAIAPTVAQDPDSAPYTTDRSVMFATAAKVLGRTAEGEKLLAGVDDRFASVRAEHPEFAGKTAAVVDPSRHSFYAFSSGDLRGRFLADLGFAPPQELNTIIGDTFGAEISSERIDVLDLDRLLLLADAKTRTWLDGNKLYQQLRVVRDGRALEIPYYEEPFAGAAMAYNTVLSVPYALTQLVGKLAAAG